MDVIWKLNKVDPKLKMSFFIDIPTAPVCLHEHEFMEITYIQKGKTVQIINGNKVECEAGDFLFFYVGDKHEYTPIGDAHILNLVFDPNLMSNMEINQYYPMHKKIESVIKLPKDERGHAAWLLKVMQAEYKNAREGYICILHNLLQSLLCILLRHGYKKDTFDDRVFVIMDIINKNCNVTLTEIADKVGYCNAHISRIFKMSTGIAIKDYINKAKMLKAYELIKSTNLSVEKVMEEIDLSNKTYFYTLFYKYIGKSPGQCRKK